MKKTLFRFVLEDVAPALALPLMLFAIVAMLLLPSLARAQAAPTQTTLSAAVTSTATFIPLTAVTGITASARVGGDAWIWVDYELIKVNAVLTNGITGQRGIQGTVARSHKNARPVVFAKASDLMWKDADPDFNSTCTRGTGQAATNWVNYRTGVVWRCTLGGVWRGMDPMPLDIATDPVFTG